MAHTTKVQEYADKYAKGEWQKGAPVPAHIIQELEHELGAKAYYLTVPEVAWIIITSAAENWKPEDTKAAIESTSWWKTKAQAQREYHLMSPADQQRAIANMAIQLHDDLRRIWGVDITNARGWTVDAMRDAATKIVSGEWTYEGWVYQNRTDAEKTPGTPAQNALTEEARKAREPAVSVENIRGDLQDLWEAWMGGHVPYPTNIAQFAKDIFENKSSMQDFEDMARSASAQMYSNKPENLRFDQWAGVPKATLQTLLEDQIRDDDPLLQSYLRGEFTLADIKNKARQDSRFDKTTTARSEKRAIGVGILEKWGLA